MDGYRPDDTDPSSSTANITLTANVDGVRWQDFCKRRKHRVPHAVSYGHEDATDAYKVVTGDLLFGLRGTRHTQDITGRNDAMLFSCFNGLTFANGDEATTSIINQEVYFFGVARTFESTSGAAALTFGHIQIPHTSKDIFYPGDAVQFSAPPLDPTEYNDAVKPNRAVGANKIMPVLRQLNWKNITEVLHYLAYRAIGNDLLGERPGEFGQGNDYDELAVLMRSTFTTQLVAALHVLQKRNLIAITGPGRSNVTQARLQKSGGASFDARTTKYTAPADEAPAYISDDGFGRFFDGAYFKDTSVFPTNPKPEEIQKLNVSDDTNLAWLATLLGVIDEDGGGSKFSSQVLRDVTAAAFAGCLDERNRQIYQPLRHLPDSTKAQRRLLVESINSVPHEYAELFLRLYHNEMQRVVGRVTTYSPPGQMNKIRLVVGGQIR